MDIRDRWDATRVVYDAPSANTILETVQCAVSEGADLRDAHLRGASLRGANLRGAHLRGAHLEGADLGDAHLGDADLRDAHLRGASLWGADLRGASLWGADLEDAHFGDVNVRRIGDDIRAVLSAAPDEASAVLQALRDGRVDGNTYQGDCACLVGTIANARQCRYDEIDGLRPDAQRLAEVWFSAIRPGDTPTTNTAARVAAECIEAWICGSPSG
jgi:uncharacterized protein YjbI with pentapeptide repeats